MMRLFWQSWFSSLSKRQKVWCFYYFSLQRKSEIVQRPWASLRAGLPHFLTTIDSSWLPTSFWVNKILWCNSKVVQRLLLGWKETIFLFLIRFFQIYLKLCCSKRKETALKLRIDLWEEMMSPFWQSRLTSLSKRQKFDVFILFLCKEKVRLCKGREPACGLACGLFWLL